TPRAAPTDATSRIASTKSSLVAGDPSTRPNGERLTAHIPLRAQMNTNLLHRSFVMLLDRLASMPAAQAAARKASARGVASPFNSPNSSRAVGLVCAMTPGSAIDEKM